MGELGPERFSEFFRALNGNSYDPFPWQMRLAERVIGGEWPPVIALPTSSGKTACIDIAIYALACQADLPVVKRTAPRRIFFVVDRRVIVDEAYERAKGIAHKLIDAKGGIVRTVTSQRLTSAKNNMKKRFLCGPRVSNAIPITFSLM